MAIATRRAVRLVRPGLALAVAGMTAASITTAVAMSPAAPRSRTAAGATARHAVTPAASGRAAARTATARGATGTTVRGATLYPLPAAAVQPTGCPPKPAPPGYGVIPRPARPAVAEAAVPAPVRLPARHVSTSAVGGTGIWVTIFKGDAFSTATASDVVSHAVRNHLTSIWIRTGSTTEGLFGQRALATLLPMAHARGLKVIAWDFPTLSNPVADAARMVATANLVESGQRVDGVSPDVETVSEGVFLTARRAAAYFSRVSAGVVAVPVVATVIRPTDYWWTAGHYPYRAEAPYVDAFAPMIYWSCEEPGAATAQAVLRLASLHRPVHAIGQAYDEGTYGRRGLPSPKEIWRFLDVAKRSGASGASLYLYSSMRGALWEALGDYPWSP